MPPLCLPRSTNCSGTFESSRGALAAAYLTRSAFSPSTLHLPCSSLEASATSPVRSDRLLHSHSKPSRNVCSSRQPSVSLVMALSLFSRSPSIFEPFAIGGSWDPFQLIDASPSRTLFARDAPAIAGTKVDWMETDDAHVFKADLPGLTKEDIKVQVSDDRTLEISGERSKEEETKTDTYHRVERSHGRFLRRFRLPENANVDKVSAKTEHGVLTVTVPKIPKQDPQTRNVTHLLNQAVPVLEKKPIR